MGHNTNCKSLQNKYKCSNCSKGYMMEYAKNNHQKICIERDKAINKNKKQYKF